MRCGFDFDIIQNFKNNSLLSHESEVNRLQDEADRFIELKHPASDTIKVLVITQKSLLSTFESHILNESWLTLHIRFKGSERCGAERVAEIPQSLHLSRNTPGQCGGIQKGEAACTAKYVGGHKNV